MNIHLILNEDIDRLEEAKKEEYVLPKSDAKVPDLEVWHDLQMKLFSLARRKGHVGVNEILLDFEELKETLEGGVFSNAK